MAYPTFNLTEFATTLRKLGINTNTCKTPLESKTLAEKIIYGRDKIHERMHLLCLLLRVPQHFMYEIFRRWNEIGNIALARYAPYASYIAIVELFLHILIASHQESGDRPSHLVDIHHLNYLPFCDIFVSNDKLHCRCTHLFLKSNQYFIKGPELKKGLKELNKYYGKLPLSVPGQGIMSFATFPPKEGTFLVSKIWDDIFPEWRTIQEVDKSKISPEIRNEILEMANAPPIKKEELDFNPHNPDTVTLHRTIRMKKGRWYQLPKNYNPQG